MQRDTGETRLLEDIPCDVLGDVFADWLDVKSLARLDSAVCSNAARPLILKLFASDHCLRGKYEFHTFGYIIAFVEWFTKRKIKLMRIQIDESSHALSKYLRLFCKSIRYVCCKDKDAIDLVAVHCRNLESFSCLCTVLKPNLHAVLASNENLRELRLEYARELYATHFEDLCLSQLALLSFNGTYCTDPVFVTLVHTTGKLQHVQIKGCYDITDAGVIVLAQHCPLLRTVGLARLKISGAAIGQLTRLCPNIETLDLERNSVLTDAGVLTIATNPSRNCGILIYHTAMNLQTFLWSTWLNFLQKPCKCFILWKHQQCTWKFSYVFCRTAVSCVRYIWTVI